jgi:antitoxin PrlF
MKSTVSEKGQITIPKALRERLGIRAGEVLELSEDQGRLVARKTLAEDPVSAAYGIIDLAGTTDEFVDDLRGKADVA